MRAPPCLTYEARIPRRDDDFPLDDTYDDDQESPRRICLSCSSVELDEYDNHA
jgi:hypothetical protein